MPKQKTHSGAKKRVARTATGKLMRRHSTGNHFLQKKSAARKRQFAGLEQMSGKQAKNIRQQMGN